MSTSCAVRFNTDYGVEEVDIQELWDFGRLLEVPLAEVSSLNIQTTVI